jgi:hypothetical protein
VAWLTKGGKEDGGDALSHGCSTRTIVDLTARHFGKNRSSKRVKTRKKSKNTKIVKVRAISSAPQSASRFTGVLHNLPHHRTSAAEGALKEWRTRAGGLRIVSLCAEPFIPPLPRPAAPTWDETLKKHPQRFLNPPPRGMVCRFPVPTTEAPRSILSLVRERAPLHRSTPDGAIPLLHLSAPPSPRRNFAKRTANDF